MTFLRLEKIPVLLRMRVMVSLRRLRFRLPRFHVLLVVALILLEAVGCVSCLCLNPSLLLLQLPLPVQIVKLAGLNAFPQLFLLL